MNFNKLKNCVKIGTNLVYKGGNMKKEKLIKTETGIYTKLYFCEDEDFAIYGEDQRLIGTIRIFDDGMEEKELKEIREIILSIGKKPE